MDDKKALKSNAPRSSSRLVPLFVLFSLLVPVRYSFADLHTIKPSVNYLVKVTNSKGTAEVYNTPSGLVQWQAGLPIPEEDNIDVVPTIATGTDTLKGVTAKLDGKVLPSSSEPEATIHVSGYVLTLGDHELDVAAKLSKRYDSARLALKFSVVASLPANLIPPPQPVVSSVKGAQQVLSGGKVAFVDPTGATVLPPLVGSIAKQVSTPGVNITFTDSAAEAQLESDQTVEVDGKLDAAVAAAADSPDTRFVYSIIRDGAIVYSCSKQLAIVGSDIHLVAHTNDTPGLYPGIVALYLWGVDDSGNYSAPTIVNLSIEDESTSTITKL